MARKENITSRFILMKAMAALFFIAAPYVFFIQDGNTFQEGIWGLLFVWAISFLILLYAKTRNKVQYDGEKFYIYNWKGKEIDIIPNEKITSMLYAGRGNYPGNATYRLFYDAADGKKKEFWIIPSWKTNTSKIKKKLKKINPNLLTSDFSFGGIEHLFIRKEDGFR